LKSVPTKSRYIVAICGAPASGKTVLASKLVRNVNSKWKELYSDGEEVEVAIGISGDGWHYSRAALDTFPDPLEARRRRGALFTFDGPSYLTFVKSLRSSPPGQPIYAPSFSHSLKDPLDDSVTIRPLPSHQLIILEGLWVALNVDDGDGTWREAARLVDERWVVEAGEEGGAKGGRERLIERHLRTGVESTLELATIRADTSDIPNGEYLLANVLEPVRRIRSTDDESFKQEGMELERGVGSEG